MTFMRHSGSLTSLLFVLGAAGACSGTSGTDASPVDDGARAAPAPGPTATNPDGPGPETSGTQGADAGTDAGVETWIKHFDNGSPAPLHVGACDNGAASVLTTRPYQRYWEDDFTRSAGLPDAYFKVSNNLHRINQEQQHYEPSQVTVDTEGLHLVAKRVAPFVAQDGVTYSYRSGEVYTNGGGDARDVAHQRYGRWEVCATLPTAQGSWPAIWLLRDEPSSPPGQVAWPPEIDIMEHVGGLSEIQTNVFWGSSAQPQSAEMRHAGVPAGGVATPHLYAVEFDANSIDYFVDGTRIRQYSVPANIPSVAMYLVLDLAVGGVLPSYRSPCDQPNAGTRMNCGDGVAAYDTGVEMRISYARMYY
jgi:hypothetical protein